MDVVERVGADGAEGAAALVFLGVPVPGPVGIGAAGAEPVDFDVADVADVVLGK